ncbi:MAG: DegV family protein [Oscillospiraceae bacterium]|nr:DegV family protein [Oscillospiraceae bacterium]
MKQKIIVDSCCDMTPELAERLGISAVVPMSMMLGEKEYIDDENLDLSKFMEEMTACKERVSTSAPPPNAFMEAIESAVSSFVVTISSQLSATFENARIGQSFASENGVTDTHIIDSKSASAGEVLVAIKLRELLAQGLSSDQIISSIENFIGSMKTYFVLERYENLIKNGRLGKVKGKIVQLMNVKLIMGSDGEGAIALHAKPRGIPQMLDKMVSFVKGSEKTTTGESMVICHNNNLPLATQLSETFKRHFDFKEILIVPMRGAISLYADNKGIVLAF